MKELTQVLEKATRAIGAGYFCLNIDGGHPIYRERVYCYELYHQMRSLWPPESPFYLNGEVDKRAHPILRELGADNAIPDLLVHQPGNMSGNHAVIEVKNSNVDGEEVTKGLTTLTNCGPKCLLVALWTVLGRKKKVSKSAYVGGYTVDSGRVILRNYAASSSS